MPSGIVFVFITDKTIGLDEGQVNPLVSPCPVSYFFHLDEEGLSIGLCAPEGIRQVPFFGLHQPPLAKVCTEEGAEVPNCFRAKDSFDGLVDCPGLFKLNVDSVFHYR